MLDACTRTEDAQSSSEALVPPVISLDGMDEAMTVYILSSVREHVWRAEMATDDADDDDEQSRSDPDDDADDGNVHGKQL